MAQIRLFIGVETNNAEQYYIEEYTKCSQDPVYFINRYGVAFNVLNGAWSPIECFPYQESAIRKFLKHKFNIILKSRQTGISVIVAAYVAWRLLFRKNQRILLLANNQDGAKRLLDHVKNFLRSLPPFLAISEEPNHPNGYITNSSLKIKLRSNDSWAEAKAASPQAGRGYTLDLAVLDEYAFTEHDEDIWTAISFALSTSNGDCITVSTPNGAGNKFHQFWTNAEKGTNAFNPIKIHWTENPLASRDLEWIENEKGELKPTSPWYEQQKRVLNNDPVKIAQELELSFLGSKRLVIDNEIIQEYKERITQNDIKPRCYYNYLLRENNRFVSDVTDLHVWEKPIPEVPYIIGADVALGNGQDYSTAHVFNAITLEQVAEYQGKIHPDKFADLLYVLAKEYNEAFLAVEGNSFGLATTFKLERRLKYRNMFYSQSFKELHVRPSGFKDYKVQRDDAIPGFQTHTKTRPLLIAYITELFTDNVVKINSMRLLSEFDTWVMIQKGRDAKPKAQHEPGYNDDLIMALGITLYVHQTHFENAVKSKRMAKAMLNAYTFNNTPVKGDNKPTDKKEEEDQAQKERLNKSGEGVYFYSNGNEQDNEDMDDLSWLISTA